MRFATKAIHVGQEPDPKTGSVIVPIYSTSTFVLDEPGKDRGYVYSRSGNPTREALEKNLAALEHGRYGLAFASGMSAITAATILLRKGDHVVVADDVYGGTYRLFDEILRNYGLDFTFVDGTRIDLVEKAFRKNTRMLWLESPTNPLLKIVDVKRSSQVARRHRAVTVLDNTFMSPYLQNPLRLGVDVVVHSTTKYLSGHSDLIGGAIVVSDRGIYEKLKFAQNAVGAVPSPFDAWLVLRGIKTLALRMEKHSSNAQAIAEFLETNSKVSEVLYPGLKNHPQSRLVRRQMRGPGGMVSIRLKNGSAASRLLKRLRIFLMAESLGGVESLIEQPSLMTHASIPRERRMRMGITDDLLRISVGIEDPSDLVDDLRQAFSNI
ncbi:MAG: cystathionine gamma-synthase [Candidatus Geothermarchaeales archaeon]